MNPIAKLIGKPFDDMNCWDLVVKYYKLFYDTELTPYTAYYPNYEDVWREIANPVKGCLLAFDLEGSNKITHVGIYLGCGEFIHSTKHVGVCIEDLSRYMNRLKGMYEYKGGEACG